MSIFWGKFRVTSRFLCANASKSVPYLGFRREYGQNRGGTSVSVVQDLVHFYVFVFFKFRKHVCIFYHLEIALRVTALVVDLYKTITHATKQYTDISRISDILL